jgi:hypothetical protein
MKKSKTQFGEPPEPVCSALARNIADALMENGFRMKARRLQLRGPNEEDLGGLNRQSIVGIIMQVIASNAPAKRSPATDK